MADKIDPDSSPDGDNADRRAPEHGLRWGGRPFHQVYGPQSPRLAGGRRGRRVLEPGPDNARRLVVSGGPTCLPGAVGVVTVASAGVTVAHQRPRSDDVASRNTRRNGTDTRKELGTHAGRTAPDIVEMTLHLLEFGIQICHG